MDQMGCRAEVSLEFRAVLHGVQSGGRPLVSEPTYELIDGVVFTEFLHAGCKND